MSSIVFDISTREPVLVVVSPKYGVFRTQIDREEVEKVAVHTWCVYKRQDRTYFLTDIKRLDGKRATLRLHRLVMNAPDGMLIDHINPNDTLDNRKSNLRFATVQENARNSRSRKGSSQYKGVSWNKQEAKWQSAITVNNKRKHLGYYTSELDAARAYDAAAIEYFGEFGYLNFPQNRAA